jgi:hypothetical protein
VNTLDSLHKSGIELIKHPPENQSEITPQPGLGEDKKKSKKNKDQEPEDEDSKQGDLTDPSKKKEEKKSKSYAFDKLDDAKLALDSEEVGK